MSNPIVDIRGYPKTKQSSPTLEVVYLNVYGIFVNGVKEMSVIFMIAKSFCLSEISTFAVYEILLSSLIPDTFMFAHFLQRGNWL